MGLIGVLVLRYCLSTEIPTHHACGGGLRSTETILHPTRAAKQGGFCLDEHLTNDFTTKMSASVKPTNRVQDLIYPKRISRRPSINAPNAPTP
jgi:hypothetical protein